MTLADLNKGDQKDLHIKLYERELRILDRLAADLNSSRSAVIGALLREHSAVKAPEPTPTPEDR